MFRRDFIKMLGLTPLGMLAPQVFGAVPSGLLAALNPANGLAGLNAAMLPGARILVLVEMKGGNDGLNTVIPYTDPAYYSARSGIAIAREQVLQLSPALGLNPALKSLMPIWQDGQLAIALGVGYPSPNRSHFRSIEIWDTASDSNEFLTQGWVTQLLAPVSPQRNLVADAVVFGGGEPGPVAGQGIKTIALSDPRRFMQEAKGLNGAAAGASTSALAHILAVQGEIHSAESTLEQKLQTPVNFKTQFPNGQFASQLRNAAQLIGSRVPLAVVKVSIGSFDTHSNQRGTQDRLLKELADGLAAFRGAMQEVNMWDKTMVMTYSEFGRRVASNASGGTDHGTAAPHIIMGGAVKGGLYGEQPSLANLDGGDLVFKIDYRSMYSTVATSWWGLPLATANGHHFSPLDCIKA